ncbi:MAG: hypothetical protein M1828_004317 [Chrysothrix sp. TS-e1954]|nr:MAG: hypothetical protein M1828_004317 [Chrysothrix sp. TS-e1954]
MGAKIPSHIEVGGGTGTFAKLDHNGRIGIDIDHASHKLHGTLDDLFKRAPRAKREASVASSTPRKSMSFKVPPPKRPPPPLNIVIQIVGSRGDVQPFVALGKTLKEKHGHRVRLATHGNFQDFVEENGLEFFNIGGDPGKHASSRLTALMAYMVKNPGLIPGMDSVRKGDIGARRKQMFEIMVGCWRSCLETGDGNATLHGGSERSTPTQINSRLFVNQDPSIRPFIADAIIANPPSFAHIHCAERLGIPVHMAFTMPWSPTHAFPHPLANINSTSVDPSRSNFISYALVDMMTWQGLGDLVNDFRTKHLNLAPLNLASAPAMESRMRIPYTYIWSPALIPKPIDWGSHINIAGFQFLDLATNYTPEPSLVEFLEAGPPPVYIGFGSIVVEEPNALTKLIFDAVKKAGVRALVSKGWGGFGAGEMDVPKEIYMLGNCPHDWLFKKVSAVCHHGGAGTTATGIANGRPTIIVPFFGDQAFWGGMVYRAGAGPQPVPNKKLTADNLAEAIRIALKPETLEKAGIMGEQIRSEDGCGAAADSFHHSLDKTELRCSLLPEHRAVWKLRDYPLRLSALAATVLVYEGCFSFRDLRVYRSTEHFTNESTKGPFVGLTTALWKTVSNMVTGLAETPLEAVHAVQAGSHKLQEEIHHQQHIYHHRHFNHATFEGSDASTLAPSVDTLGNSPASLKHDDGGFLSVDTIHEDPASEKAANEKEASATARPPIARLPTMKKIGTKNNSDGDASAVAYVPTLPATMNPLYLTILNYIFNSSTGSGVFIGALVKFPGIFTMSLTRGFHGVPYKWGDPLFRPLPRVTGLHSGLKAAATILPMELWDGITGVVREPIACGRQTITTPSEDNPDEYVEEETRWRGKGIAKGVAIGLGGLIFKPMAGIWGVPGFCFHAIYRELSKTLGKGVDIYIFIVRRVEGHKVWEKSEKRERDEVLRRWTEWWGSKGKGHDFSHAHTVPA